MTERPNRADFQRAVDSGLAAEDAVWTAYDAAFEEWAAGKAYGELLAGALASGDVLGREVGQERPEFEPHDPTFDARIIQLRTERHFKGDR